MPASRAIRSSSDGHTYRNGTETTSVVVAVEEVVVRDQPLRGDVVLVEAEPRRADVERLEGLAGRQSLQTRHPHFDHEAAARLQVRGDVLEAGDLLVLRRQVHDRVEDEVRERERPVDPGRGEVADRDADRLAAGLGSQSFDHRGREVDAVHANAALRQRQRDAPGADPELERGAVARQVCEEVDDRIDRLRTGDLRP